MNRGPKACPVSRSVSVDRVVNQIFDEVHARVARPDLIKRLVSDVQATDAKAGGVTAAKLTGELETQRARVKNLLDAVAALGPQPDVLARYKEEQARTQQLEADLQQAQQAVRVPTEAEIRSALEEMRGAGGSHSPSTVPHDSGPVQSRRDPTPGPRLGPKGLLPMSG